MDEISKKGSGETDSQPAEPCEAQGDEAARPEAEQLRQQLDAKEAELKGLYDRLLRQAADLENFKKRVAREKEETIRYGNEALIRDLLPVLDNLQRAVEHARGGGNGQPLLDGIEMVLKSVLDVLGKFGVVQISAKGEPFDPEKHEAIAQVESHEHEPNTVVEEFHKGYYLFDRLLRPALVSVSKPPERKDKKTEEGKVEKKGTDD